MSTEQTCGCNAAPKYIFACSGAADVGAVADQAARKLTRDGVGNMYCLAGIGGRVNIIMKNTQAAGAILAIDGCPTECVRHCLEEAGFADFAHLQLAGLGLEKGQTPVSSENVTFAADAGTKRLNDYCKA